jgi:hypothetical protein
MKSGGKTTVQNQDKATEPSYVESFLRTVNPGYIVAGISAMTAALLSIGKDYHKKKQRNGYFDGVDKAHREAQKLNLANTTDLPKDEEYPALFAKVAEEVREKLKPKGLDETAIGKHISKAQSKMRMEYVRAIEKQGGVRVDNPVLRLWDKWGGLEGHQKLRVGMTFTTVFSFALGAMYSITHEHRLAMRLKQEKAKEAELQKQAGASIQ